MLWHVENTNFRILGSVHVSDRVLRLSASATQAIEDAKILAFETNVEFSPNSTFTHFKEPDTLVKKISTSLYADAKKLWFDLGLEGELENFRPWYAANRLGNALTEKHGFVHNLGIDFNVLKLAKKEKKKPFFLEPTGAASAAFAKAPLTEQEISLSRVVRNTTEILQEVALIVNAWASADQAVLRQVVERALQLTPVTYSNVLAGRNRAWLPQLVRLARSQKNTVAVVGVLHMLGPENIPQLLADAGLKCTFVEPDGGG